MKKLFTYIRDFTKRPRFALEFVFGMAFTALALWINESWGGEKTWIDGSATQSLRLLKYLALYGLAFGGGYLFQLVLYRNDKALRLPKLWGAIVFAVVLFSIRAWVQPYPLIQGSIPPEYQTVVWKYLYNGAGLLVLALPVLLFWAFSGDRKEMPPYGFKLRHVALKPYFILLIIMLAPLVLASEQPDFQEMYPRAAHLALPPHGPHNTLLTVIYEIVYSLDYVVTEFFFRGFLVLHFARFVGRKAILPMCMFYVVIHFDKPLAEAISSYFGGMILGILALRTRSIYGGIILHVGIALLMELLGFMHSPLAH